MYKIRTIKYSSGKKELYLGLIAAKDLVDNYLIDAHTPRNLKGYQRQLKKSRSKKFGDYLFKLNGIFHQTLLLNIRNAKKFKFNSRDDIYGNLEVKDKVYIVDGQHRLAGLKFLLEQHPSASNMPIPVLITIGLNGQKEAEQFLIINKTQKGVKGQLQDKLIAHVVDEMDPELLLAIGITSSQKDIRKFMDISENLSKNKNSVWYKKITLTEATRKHGETIKLTSLNQGIKRVVDNDYIKATYKSINKITAMLIKYWDAIAQLCPKACGKDAKDYVLLKPCGAYVMHKLFPFVLIKCGHKPTTSKMKKILSNIAEMDDDEWHKEGSMNDGSGHGFWDKKVTNFKDQME